MNNTIIESGNAISNPESLTGYFTTARLAGISALAFATGVLLANFAVAGAPLASATAAEAANWYEINPLRMIIANGMVALTFPALLLFGATMYELGRGQAEARQWMLVGALSSVAMVAVFSILVAGNISAVLLAETGGSAFAAAWTIHNAAFAINMSVLGMAFLGFAIGAYAAGLTPAWQRTAGVAGATLLLATGFGNTIVAGGSAFVFLGFIGFILWLVWIVAIGIRLTGKPV